MLFGNGVLTFTAGTTVLTQCIPAVLSPDSNIEPSSLLENIFAVNETFLGETSTVTLGQLFAVDASGELIDMEHKDSMKFGYMHVLLTWKRIEISCYSTGLNPLKIIISLGSTVLRRRGHATPHSPVETAKCWWLLKIEPSLSLKPAQTPLKNGPKPLAKLYNSPKNSRAPTA